MFKFEAVVDGVAFFVIFWKSFLLLRSVSLWKPLPDFTLGFIHRFFYYYRLWQTHTNTYFFAHSNTSRYRIDVQFQKIESIHRDRRQKIWTNPSEHLSSNHRGKIECRCVTNLFPFAHEIHYDIYFLKKCHTASANYWIIDSLTG